MKRFTNSQLWAFVNRADTHEKIQIADAFLSKLDYLNIDVYHEMMDALAYKSRELYRDTFQDEPDEFLDAYHATEDEYERRLMRMRSYNLL